MAIRGWLQTRKEKAIMKDVVEFTQKILETVHEFERAFEFLAKEKKPELADTVFHRVLKLEHEADQMRKNILLEITKSDLDSHMRQDLTILVKRIDKIANEADAASRTIIGFKFKPIYMVGDDALDVMSEIIHKTVEATKLLFGLIKRFGEMEDAAVFNATGRIDQIEHECDKLHTALYMLINEKDYNGINPFIAYQIVKFVDSIEYISNRIEDVCDYIDLIKTLESSQL